MNNNGTLEGIIKMNYYMNNTEKSYDYHGKTHLKFGSHKENRMRHFNSLHARF